MSKPMVVEILVMFQPEMIDRDKRWWSTSRVTMMASNEDDVVDSASREFDKALRDCIDKSDVFRG